MLNETQKKTLERLETLKKEVDLLESHKLIFNDNEEFVHITPKQYNESAHRILSELEEIEHEYGIFEDHSINRKFKEVNQELDVIRKMLNELLRCMTEECYNIDIQLAIDDVIEEIKDEHFDKNQTDKKAM